MRPSFLLALSLLAAACGGTSTTDPLPGGPPAATGAVAKHPPPPPEGDPSAATTGPTDKSWCAIGGIPHALCADFDQGVRPFGWEFFDGDDTSNKDPYDFTTPGRSGYAFHVSGPALKGPGDQSGTGPFDGAVVDARALPTTASEGRIGFDIKVDTIDDAFQPVQLTSRKKDKSFAYDVWFVTSATSTEILATFDGAGPNDTAAQFPPLPTGRWVHVDIYLNDKKGTVSFSFDGQPIGSVPFSGKLADGYETTLYVGVTRTAPSGAYDMSFDDVTLDWQ